ncbi:MAG: hypothetical protein AAF481_20345, partial [Acidobacteriota bacterium]
MWLQTRPREEIVLFAARVALRALPALELYDRDEAPAALILTCLRAVAAPWLAGTWPSQGAEVRNAADFSAAAAAAAAAAASDAASDAAYFAAYFASSASSSASSSDAVAA